MYGYLDRRGRDIMSNKHLRRFGLILTAVVLLVFFADVGALAQGEIVDVTSPAEGESVASLITITGTVDFSDFQKYELFLKNEEQMLWAATAYAPVIDGNLARLDTKTFPDGAYQLIIRQVRTDSNYTEFLGPTFYIENNLGAPVPYPEVESSFLYSPVAGALARVRNCSGDRLEFNYNSPEGFCSGDDVWIPFKDAASSTCPYLDILLTPCEYRGTARGQGTPKGATYSFLAEAGKIYELTYPGGDQIYIAEVEGDARAETDTGSLEPGDPARLQSTVATEDETENEAVSVADKAPAPTEIPESVAPPGETSAQSESMLPVSGQGTRSNMIFIAVAVGLIILLVGGGVLASRKRNYSA
jgi:hypothetical protein